MNLLPTIITIFLKRKIASIDEDMEKLRHLWQECKLGTPDNVLILGEATDNPVKDVLLVVSRSGYGVVVQKNP